MNTEIRKPKQTAPVARSIVGNQADLLAELSEETLIGVTASVVITTPFGQAQVTCAYAGDSDE
jgi:bacteriocin leader peptide (microcyclamide/patellamide family)